MTVSSILSSETSLTCQRQEVSRIDAKGDILLDETTAVVVHSRRGSVQAKDCTVNFINAKRQLDLTNSLVNWVILKVFKGQEGEIFLNNSTIAHQLWIMSEDPSNPVTVHIYQTETGSRIPKKIIFRYCEGVIHHHLLQNSVY